MLDNQKKTRVTLKDVASMCGYSANTVSRALRNDTRLPEITRMQIVSTAEKMRYVPNLSACTLRLGNSKTVAVVINDINNPYYTNMVTEIDRCLSKTQYSMMILPCRDDEQTAGKMIEVAISQCVDGIMFFPFNNKKHVQRLNQSGIPFVLMDRWIPEVTANVVRLDDEAGGYTAVRYLIEKGHKKIVYIAWPTVNSSQIDRQRGVLKAFADFDIRDDQYTILSWERISGGLSAEDYETLFAPGKYTAVIAYNDYIAYHLMNYLRDFGMRIPEDLAIIGFDDIRRYNSCFPPLSSVSAAKENVSEVAVQLLMQHIHEPRTPVQEIVLPISIRNGGTA